MPAARGQKKGVNMGKRDGGEPSHRNSGLRNPSHAHGSHHGRDTVNGLSPAAAGVASDPFASRLTATPSRLTASPSRLTEMAAVPRFAVVEDVGLPACIAANAERRAAASASLTRSMPTISLKDSSLVVSGYLRAGRGGCRRCLKDKGPRPSWGTAEKLGLANRIKHACMAWSLVSSELETCITKERRGAGGIADNCIAACGWAVGERDVACT